MKIFDRVTIPKKWWSQLLNQEFFLQTTYCNMTISSWIGLRKWWSENYVHIKSWMKKTHTLRPNIPIFRQISWKFKKIEISSHSISWREDPFCYIENLQMHLKSNNEDQIFYLRLSKFSFFVKMLRKHLVWKWRSKMKILKKKKSIMLKSKNGYWELKNLKFNNSYVLLIYSLISCTWRINWIELICIRSRSVDFEVVFLFIFWSWRTCRDFELLK